jgi:hypothetical protein
MKTTVKIYVHSENHLFLAAIGTLDSMIIFKKKLKFNFFLRNKCYKRSAVCFS